MDDKIIKKLIDVLVNMEAETVIEGNSLNCLINGTDFTPDEWEPIINEYAEKLGLDLYAGMSLDERKNKNLCEERKNTISSKAYDLLLKRIQKAKPFYNQAKLTVLTGA